MISNQKYWFRNPGARHGVPGRACWILVVTFLALTVVAEMAGAEPLDLADSGRTKYAIVIAKNAHYGENMAAEELGHFLWGVTGAEFTIRRDSEPASEFEIVVGNTNRKKMEEIPGDLRTDNWEGFTLFREDAKLYIMGNIPRATLFGVYDFLDVELGVRFLTAEVTHVPAKPMLKVQMKSRTFSPRFERRTIWSDLGGASKLRNRMNGAEFYLIDSKLGGIKWVGPATHTFFALVSPDKYFEKHPEYFSQIEGVRYREYKGIVTQLCLTNPDVLRIATETARGWLGPEVKADSNNKYVVSVTVNDSLWACKCAECVAVNKEEGVVEGGTNMRFVNAIATRLAEEYPAVSVEMMTYAGVKIPKKTKPVSNVIIQIVADPDWRYALDDPSYEINRHRMKFFEEMKDSIGEGGVYNWTKHVIFGDYLIPAPNLKYIARNMRIMNENGVKGFFCQTVQSRGLEMQDLRYYLLARAMWRPEVDSQETIEEFCRLYYGHGGDGVLRYIDFLHDNYRSSPASFSREGAWPYYRSRWDLMRTKVDASIVYDDEFVARADAILAEAELKAQTPEIKQRVATCRLPIWKMKLDRAFGEVGKVVSFPETWSFKIDPDDKGLAEQWQKARDLTGWATMKTDRHWTYQGEEHRGVAWYGIDFDMPETRGTPLALWFGAIDGDADIYIDGEKVGEQKIPAMHMWQHGFFIPLPKGLSHGNHRLVVRVFKKRYNAGIWKPVSIVDMSAPISDDLRTAGERFIDVGRKADLAVLSESYGPKYTQTEKMYYPKTRFFLTHGGVQ